MGPFGRKKQAGATSGEQAGIVHFPLADDAYGTVEEREAFFALEDKLTEAAAALGGEHDGNEFGDGEAVLYTYGPDADALFEAISECLSPFPLLPGAFAIKRYGRADNPHVREERVPLDIV